MSFRQLLTLTGGPSSTCWRGGPLRSTGYRSTLRSADLQYRSISGFLRSAALSLRPGREGNGTARRTSIAWTRSQTGWHTINEFGKNDSMRSMRISGVSINPASDGVVGKGEQEGDLSLGWAAFPFSQEIFAAWLFKPQPIVWREEWKRKSMGSSLPACLTHREH